MPLGDAQQAQLEDILVRRQVELETFLADSGLPDAPSKALAALPWLAGDAAVLGEAREIFQDFPAALAALDELDTLVSVLSQRGVTLHLDLGELRGYHYHTGCVFAAYLPGESEPVAKGGRYDHIGEVFGRARPATGFSADLKMLSARTVAAGDNGILAEGSLQDADFAAAVAALRDQGERVVLALPGADNDALLLGCQRRLVQGDNGWVIQDK